MRRIPTNTALSVLLLLIVFSKGLAQADDPLVEAVHLQATDLGVNFANGRNRIVDWVKSGNNEVLAFERRFVLINGNNNRPLVVAVTVGYFDTSEKLSEAWHSVNLSNVGASAIDLGEIGLPLDHSMYLVGNFPNHVRGVKNGFIFDTHISGGGPETTEDFRASVLLDVILTLSGRIDSQATSPTPAFGWGMIASSNPSELSIQLTPLEPLSHPTEIVYLIYDRRDSTLVAGPVEVSAGTLEQVDFSIDTTGLTAGDYLLVVTAFDDFLLRTVSNSFEFSKNQDSGSISLPSSEDAILSLRNPHQNDGSNPLLTLEKIQGKATRSLVAFNIGGIDLNSLSSATLVLAIDSSQAVNGWGNGRTISVRPINLPWQEGNGWSFGLKKKDQIAGNGTGATWFSPADQDISNDSANSAINWDGATSSVYPPTAPSVQIANFQSGEVAFDVTTDVLNGAENGWLIIKDQENVGSKVSFYSREGAAAAGNPDLAPRLILELGAPVASAAPPGVDDSFLAKTGLGSISTRFRATQNGGELRSLREVLQNNPVAALTIEQLLSAATRNNPVLNLTARTAYRSWLAEDLRIAAVPVRIA